MLVQFAIWPEDRPHMQQDVERARRVLTEAGLTFEVGPMGTTVEGPWREVFAAIEKCHHSAADQHARVLTTITVDDDQTREQSIRATMEKVGALERA